MQNNLTLITGCQRSGTTLLNLILDAHPEILSLDEDRFHLPSISAYLNGGWYPPFICFKLPQYAHLTSLIKTIPGLKVIWCVRDSLDTIWSMINLNVASYKNQPICWAAHPVCAQLEIRNAIWSLPEADQKALSGFMKDFAMIIRKHPFERSRAENIFVGSLCWTIKNALTRGYAQENINFYEVPYETLVNSPRTTIESALRYIGADWSDDVLKHHEIHQGESIGSTSNTRPIDNRSVGLGHAGFTKEEKQQIESVCKSIESS